MVAPCMANNVVVVCIYMHLLAIFWGSFSSKQASLALEGMLDVSCALSESVDDLLRCVGEF